MFEWLVAVQCYGSNDDGMYDSPPTTPDSTARRTSNANAMFEMFDLESFEYHFAHIYNICNIIRDFRMEIISIHALYNEHFKQITPAPITTFRFRLDADKKICPSSFCSLQRAPFISSEDRERAIVNRGEPFEIFVS